MPEMIIYNGLAVSQSDPGLPFFNRSFRYGDGVFESMRIRKNKLLFWDHHMDRLQKGLAGLHLIPPPQLIEKLAAGVNELRKQNRIGPEGKVRMHFFRTGEPPYTPVTDETEYIIEVSALKQDSWPMPPGLRVMLYTDILLSASPISSLKTANALPYILAARAARAAQFDDALLHCGTQLSECTSSNFFLVKEGKLLTPGFDSACLDGVMRRQVLRLADQLGITAQETRLEEKDLTGATEAFATNSIGGIRPILSIASPTPGSPALFSATEMGPTTYTLHTALLAECE